MGQAHTPITQSPGPQEGLQSHLLYCTPLAVSEPGACRLETWHLSWPLAQPSKPQRMDLFSLPFSKDQGGEVLGQVGLFP